jgi:long-chain acyl-CoA synthetase
LVTPTTTLTHGDLRRRAARVQAWLEDQDPGRPLLLATEPPDVLLPAFIAAGALGRSAAVGDGHWPIGPRGLVERALGAPLRPPPDLMDGLGSSRDATLTIDPAPERPFYLGFTSGSSGLPKGYARSHGSWIATMVAARDAFGLVPGETILALGPLSHSLALYATIQALWLGGTARLNGRPEGARVMVGIPPLLATRRREASAPGVDLILSAGQALDVGQVDRLRTAFPGARIIDFYGTSEQSFIAWRDAGEGAPGSVGHPFPGVHLEIVDAAGTPLPPGALGRLRVDSPMVFEGYLPGLEGNGFARDGAWTTVGDRGWLDADGCLHLAGREGGMVVVRGVNVYPEEVEAALKALPGVVDAGVVGLPDPDRGALVVALVEGRAPAPGELADLPLEKRPRRVLSLPVLPRTATGKLDRAALARLAGENP